MRPPSMWQGVDETPKTLGPRGSSSSDKPASRIDAAQASALSRTSAGNGLKRTLSVAVEQDAKRIAQMKVKPKASLDNVRIKAIPASSPVRPPAESRNMTHSNAQWNQQAPASSPGWRGSAAHPPQDPPETTGDNFDPVQRSLSNMIHDTPNTTIRKILGPLSSATAPARGQPLSDGSEMGQAANIMSSAAEIDWGVDLSQFFNLEGFSLPQDTLMQADYTQALGNPHADSTGHVPSDFEASRNDVQPHGMSEGSDDVISQLFNRTSSVGYDSSSPARFDFSTLPPSSPPMIPSDLPHSALLLSSPDMSPWERKTSPAKSSIKSSYTPLPDVNGQLQVNMTRSYSDSKSIQSSLTPQTAGTGTTGPSNSQSGQTLDAQFNGDVLSQKSFEELFGRMIEHSQQQHQHQTGGGASSGQGQGLDEQGAMSDADILSFLEKSMAAT